MTTRVIVINPSRECATAHTKAESQIKFLIPFTVIDYLFIFWIYMLCFFVGGNNWLSEYTRH